MRGLRAGGPRPERLAAGAALRGAEPELGGHRRQVEHRQSARRHAVPVGARLRVDRQPADVDDRPDGLSREPVRPDVGAGQHVHGEPRAPVQHGELDDVGRERLFPAVDGEEPGPDGQRLVWLGHGRPGAAGRGRPDHAQHHRRHPDLAQLLARPLRRQPEAHQLLRLYGCVAELHDHALRPEADPQRLGWLHGRRAIPCVSILRPPSPPFCVAALTIADDAVVLSSLTLGGYDSSRFIPNDITFEFAPDNERDIVVGIVGITANSSTKPATSLLKRDSFTMYIDSTVAELWLPIEVCEAFEDAFGLSYDNDTGLYLLDDQTHQRLLAENPSITFSLGQKFTTNATVDITLPYAALDLEASPPYRGLENATKYFPIRRGEKESQFVLGRTFLQEAYLLVDWERQNFSVYECSWVYGQEENIVPIISPVYTGENKASKPHHLTTGTIIGIALGAGFGFAITVCGIIWFFWRRRHKRKLAKVKADYEAKAAAAAKEPPAEKREDPPTSPTQDAEEGTKVFPKAELPADSVGRPEMSCDRKEADPNSLSTLVEVDNTERQVFEMLGDIPSTVEAGGRQLSEKESMMVRERIYNGVDPYGTPDVSPTAEDAPRRQAPVSPSEVAMVNRRLPDVSPTTPRARDGASLEANDTFFQPPAPRAPRDGRYLEAEDTLLSPISPLEGSADTSRRRFSYES